jgi:adenosylcobinamide-GDP ribazoletransferase
MMAERDAPLVEPGDLAAALALMTRIPVPAGDRGARASWAWPLAGALVALAAGLCGWVALALGTTPGVAAALVLALGMLVTGALHEDGLADSADGLFGGTSRDRRLEIMKDSRVGSFGALALILVTLARWSALTALFAAGIVLGPLIAAAAISRSVLPVTMIALPPARALGLSAATGRPPRAAALIGLALAALVALLFVGWTAIPCLAAAGVAAFFVGLAAWSRIRGQTGDVLGATQQVAEVAVLAVLAAV